VVYILVLYFTWVNSYLYLTIADPKNKKRLRELTRIYEVLVDYFAFDNEYGSTDQLWQNYFLAFNYLAQL